MEQARANGHDLSTMASVASFFVSRVDSEVDKRLDEIGTDAALALRGTAAIANARLAYQAWQDAFGNERWATLKGAGAKVAASAVGLHRREEQGLPRHALRHRARRARHGEHDARGHARRRSPTTASCTATPCRAPPTPPARCSPRSSSVGIDLDDVFKVIEDEGVAEVREGLERAPRDPRPSSSPGAARSSRERARRGAAERLPRRPAARRRRLGARREAGRRPGRLQARREGPPRSGGPTRRTRRRGGSRG